MHQLQQQQQQQQHHHHHQHQQHQHHQHHHHHQQQEQQEQQSTQYTDSGYPTVAGYSLAHNYNPVVDSYSSGLEMECDPLQGTSSNSTPPGGQPTEYKHFANMAAVFHGSPVEYCDGEASHTSLEGIVGFPQVSDSLAASGPYVTDVFQLHPSYADTVIAKIDTNPPIYPFPAALSYSAIACWLHILKSITKSATVSQQFRNVKKNGRILID